MTNPALTNGPLGDGSQSLSSESRWGHAVSLVTTAAALALAGVLTNFDMHGVPAYLIPLASAATGTVAGLLTSWVKKNKRDYYGRVSDESAK